VNERAGGAESAVSKVAHALNELLAQGGMCRLGLRRSAIRRARWPCGPLLRNVQGSPLDCLDRTTTVVLIRPTPPNENGPVKGPHSFGGWGSIEGWAARFSSAQRWMPAKARYSAFTPVLKRAHGSIHSLPKKAAAGHRPLPNSRWAGLERVRIDVNGAPRSSTSAARCPDGTQGIASGRMRTRRHSSSAERQCPFAAATHGVRPVTRSSRHRRQSR
jgi:hypothetical protein